MQTKNQNSERGQAIVLIVLAMIVLLGFRVQYRGQTEGTYKLLFGALRWAAMS